MFSSRVGVCLERSLPEQSRRGGVRPSGEYWVTAGAIFQLALAEYFERLSHLPSPAAPLLRRFVEPQQEVMGSGRPVSCGR